MKKKYKIRLEIFSLVCMIFLIILSAAPLYNSSSKASIIGLIASSFGTGVALSNLIHDERKIKQKKDK